jgi:hypothetical protein
MSLGTGWLKDPHDVRDIPLSGLLNRKPRKLDNKSLEEFLPEPYDQGSTSSCVANAGSAAIYTRWRALGYEITKPSVLFLYSIARATHNAEESDEGTYIRGLCRAMRVMGIAPDNVMPFNPAQINTRPNWTAIRAAYDQRNLSGYYSIQGTGQDRISKIQAALVAGYPVVFGLDLDQSWQDYQGGVLKTPKEPLIGGHATFLYGYGNGLFFGQNSWGTAWGEHGRYRIEEAALASEYASDIWVLDTVPEYSGT